jgi:hypothetical protein
MNEILALLQSIVPVIRVTTLGKLRHVIYGMLTSNRQVTMLEISRWT